MDWAEDFLHLSGPDCSVIRERIGFSTLKVSKPEKYIVEELEYHKTTWEMFMPLNDDAVLHAAPKVRRGM